MVVLLLTLLFCVTNTSIRATYLWPVNADGTVFIKYFFDSSIPEGDIRRESFRKAVTLYRESTCIYWIEVAPNTEERHVKVLNHNLDCSSNIGIIPWGQNSIYLSDGCTSVRTMLHEMAHTLGMEHVHQRPDRDKYVEVWEENIIKDKINNFVLKSGSTQSTPYDYLSIMHYESSDFSANELYTMTPKNRLAVFSAGIPRPDFRWSDAAWINRAYNCEKLFLTKCQKLDCMNGGYTGRECKCICPENTKGRLCERITGDLFNVKPECGGVVKKDGEITAYGVYTCVYQIIAPLCKVPQITITKAYFHIWACSINRLILHYMKSKFGDV